VRTEAAPAEAQYLTVAEFARRLRVAPVTIYRRIGDGSLAAVRLGPNGPIRVRASELDRLALSREHVDIAEEA
jgi:excisionase family DNA binding protein